MEMKGNKEKEVKLEKQSKRSSLFNHIIILPFLTKEAIEKETSFFDEKKIECNVVYQVQCFIYLIFNRIFNLKYT